MGKKWAKPDVDKRTPIPVTPLMLEVMAYGHQCVEFGKWQTLAIKAKTSHDPKQPVYWANAFKAKDKMEELLRSIGQGWPVTEPHGNFVELPKPKEDTDG